MDFIKNRNLHGKHFTVNLNNHKCLKRTPKTPLSEDIADRGLDKRGAGQLVLTGSNGYSGVTNVYAGILQPATAAALPGYDSAGKVVFNGIKVDYRFQREQSPGDSTLPPQRNNRDQERSRQRTDQG